jgi:histidinol dehydrogenase
MNSGQFKAEVLGQLANRGSTRLSSISSDVKAIIADVRENGDDALIRYTEKLDNARLPKSRLRVTEDEIKGSYEKLREDQVKALQEAAANIARFHKAQMRDEWSLSTVKGVTVGQVVRPLSAVGVYAPGGKAPYPSTVLMCAVPARVAGVKRVILCSPPTKNEDIDSALLVAADLAGVNEVYRVGGVQAIAAMAYGTETVSKVDKIVGPGNQYVAAAKLEISKDVAIDLPAGPSEVLVIADETANPAFVASDLLAQAEHDPNACTILLTTSEDFAEAVGSNISTQMRSLSRVEAIESSIKTGGLIVVVKDIQEAVEYANAIAPEHLHIQTRTPRKTLDGVFNAGAVFLGQYSPVAFGDYSSGLNHVLPTGGYARSYSGLSIRDFVKVINFIECNKQGYVALKKTTLTLADMEGFDGHAKSVSIRE